MLYKDKLQKEKLLILARKVCEAGIAVECISVEEDYPIDPFALYITDCSETVRKLKLYHLAVLGFLHEGSTSLDVMYALEEPQEADIRYLERVYRRCHGIPWDILETDRCILRETMVEDVDTFWEIYQHPEITRYNEGLYPEPEQEKEYIRQYIDTMYKYYEFGVWTVIEKSTGEIIGRAGFSIREGYDLPELGFVISVPWQGKGLAYEICQAILRYGKNEFDFQCVQALVMPENKVSLSLCRKLGFEKRDRLMNQGKEYLLLTVIL